MTIHGSLFQEFKEKDTQDPFSLQNKKMLRIDMRYRSRHFRVELAPGEEPFILIIAATPQCPR